MVLATANDVNIRISLVDAEFGESEAQPKHVETDF